MSDRSSLIGYVCVSILCDQGMAQGHLHPKYQLREKDVCVIGLHFKHFQLATVEIRTRNLQA